MSTVGLTSKEIAFNIDGDGFHVDQMLKEAFPILDHTGGYTLLRPNGRELVLIEPPKGGFTTRYLKDITKSLRLYVRPLQSDITEITFTNSKDKVIHNLCANAYTYKLPQFL